MEDCGLLHTARRKLILTVRYVTVRTSRILKHVARTLPENQKESTVHILDISNGKENPITMTNGIPTVVYIRNDDERALQRRMDEMRERRMREWENTFNDIVSRIALIKIKRENTDDNHDLIKRIVADYQSGIPKKK